MNPPQVVGSSIAPLLKSVYELLWEGSPGRPFSFEDESKEKVYSLGRDHEFKMEHLF